MTLRATEAHENGPDVAQALVPAVSRLVSTPLLLPAVVECVVRECDPGPWCNTPCVPRPKGASRLPLNPDFISKLVWPSAPGFRSATRAGRTQGQAIGWQ